MNYMGSMFLNDGPIGRSTIKINATLAAKSPLSNGTIIKYDGTIYSICATLADIDNTVVGVVKVHPDGATVVNGDELDVSCGTIRIDIDAYENTRANLTPNTMCNISTLTSNKAVTGNGCIIQFEKPCR